MEPRIMKLLVLIVGLFFITIPTFSQSKFALSVGIGGPECYNVKIKYGQHLQFGICAGAYIGPGLFGSDEIIVQGLCAAEIEYHFLGKSNYVEQPPWYILGGLGYYDIPISGLYGKYDIGFYPRIGRTFNLSKRLGINLDVGPFIPLSMTSDYTTYDFNILLSGNISLLIRL